MIRTFLVCFLLLQAVLSFGQLPLRLPSVLSDHAVLQQDADVKVWGWGPGSMRVGVVCSWNPKDTIFASIGADCTWEVSIHTPRAGATHSIVFICGNQKITITDIILGEVWLCSGQSNMEFNMNWGITDAGDALANCSNNDIRFFQVEQAYDKFPQTNCQGKWVVCDQKTMPTFSSVGYFFGRRLNDVLKVPVGLIGAYWGGTCIQPWIPGEFFIRDTETRKLGENIEPYAWAPEGASVLYNAMIYPIAGYKIAGVVWYQGEANVVREPNDYLILFNALIGGWRNAFSSNFPFYFVQIAPWNGYNAIDAAYLREQQEFALQTANTGMIAVADLVDDVSNIHPGKKRTVGERLSNLALKEQYGKAELAPYFPHFNQFFVQSDKAIVSFVSRGKIACKDKQIENFQLAGSDKRFYAASAILKKDGTIQLSAPEVKEPVAVRYCFTNAAVPNLFDLNNLPLLPFRTDKW